jgi:Mrp family chromosome partitioning ATPase/capsular polysaccharide biosynthesis protein
MTVQDSDGLSIGSYLRIAARWKWLIIAVTVVVTVLGSAYTWTRTPMYSATANLIYVKPVDIGNPLNQSYIDSTAQQAEIESVPAVIASAQVGADARKRMKPATIAAGYYVSALLQMGNNNLYSNVVGINGSSSSAAAAADAANAYAEAFITWGRENTRSQIADAIDVVNARLASFTTTESRQGADYRSLTQRLQDLELLEASARGDFQVITPAYPPSAPYSPDKKRGVAVALVLGLVLGIGLAFLIEQFDVQVHSEEQVVEALALPVVGHVPSLTRKDRDGGSLLTLSDPSGQVAEAYRLLRSNLDFAAIDADIRTLMVSSSVQGEGKSVLAGNLAVSLAMAGKRVTLVDADLRGPRVHVYMNLPNVRGVSTVVTRRDDLREALLNVRLKAGPLPGEAIVTTAKTARLADAEGGSRAASGRSDSDQVTAASWPWSDAQTDGPSLRVLTSGPLPPNPGELVASRRFGEVIKELAADSDLVLVDAPAMLPVGDTAALAAWVDALVFVVDPTKLKRPLLHRAKAQLDHLPCRILGCVFVEPQNRQTYQGYYSHSVDGNGRTRH